MTNPYLNTPPTRLERMIAESSGKKRQLMVEALQSWRIVQPNPRHRQTVFRDSTQKVTADEGQPHELEPLIEWLSSQYPRQTFKIQEQESWKVMAGMKCVIEVLPGQNIDDNWVVNFHGDLDRNNEQLSHRGGLPPLRDLKKSFLRMMAGSPGLETQFQTRVSNPQHYTELTESLKRVHTFLSEALMVPVKVEDHGDIEAGDYVCYLYYGDTYNENTAFTVTVNSRARQFRIQCFNYQTQTKTVQDLVALLKKPGTLLRTGLSTVDPGVKEMLLGQMTTANAIRRVVKVLCKFETTEEWHTTHLLITLALRTRKPVPEWLIQEWVKQHWDDVVKAAPSKTPPPAESPYSGRSDYDSYQDASSYGGEYKGYPKEGLGWMIPNRMRLQDVDSISVGSQNGSSVVVQVSQKIR